MYICICNGVTESDIATAAKSGVASMQELQDTLKVATCCGACAEYAEASLYCSLTQNYQRH